MKSHPVITLSHLDNLWFQATGTLCNISCAHCFNNSGPNVRTLDFLSLEDVRRDLETARRLGVKEIFFTGGEPFLHPQLPAMLTLSLELAPATVLTNGLLINDRMAERLAEIERSARYSLEIRVSLDGYNEEINDAIRGNGVFRQAMAAIVRLSRQGLLPLVTVVRTWGDENELATVAAFVRALRDAGYTRPRIKILPALPLGRELTRSQSSAADTLLNEAMFDGFDRDLLMCSNSRIVTDRGVWVCPLLVEKADAWLGSTLAGSCSDYELRHHACVSCYQYGTICGNVNSLVEGPSKSPISGDAKPS